MASVRNIKKDIDYLVGEVVSDCYVAMYFHPAKKTELSALVDKAIELHTGLMHRANNPVEKNNPSLVKKHYAQLRRDMFTGIDALFSSLSDACKV